MKSSRGLQAPFSPRWPPRLAPGPKIAITGSGRLKNDGTRIRADAGSEALVMSKLVLSVLGPDRPGIIAAVTRILFEQDCNIENVSQTILQSEFSGIFIVSIPEETTPEALRGHLTEGLSPLKQHVFVKCLEPHRPVFNGQHPDPFVITTRGPDQKGLVARVAETIARHGVNVTNLQAVFKGGSDPDANVMIYEVDVPSEVDQQRLRNDLRERARELGLEISIQHRKIFEVLNRI
jgi:glycine cleavage system transcriptional repressor